MTIRMLWRVLRKRWYIVALGIGCIAGTFAAFIASPRVYFAQTDVVFVAPGDEAIGGLNDRIAQTLIDFAAVVEKKVNAERPSFRLASPTATLYGTGVSEGTSVALADAGGQWEHSFNRPVLSVQVVDSSAERVRKTLSSIVENISSTATSLQSESGADPARFITIETAPAISEVGSIGPTRASVVKGFAALTVAGLGLTGAAAVLVDRLTVSLSARRRGFGSNG